MNDAEDTRKVACTKNKAYQEAVNEISSKIIQESEKGEFGTTYLTRICDDNTLNAIKHNFQRQGYVISWELNRGVGCPERIFIISWY